jgi:predicted NBD/HSP70 family sugar kinase
VKLAGRIYDHSYPLEYCLVSLLVGVDVGGTTSTVAIANDQHQVLIVSEQFPTRSIDGPCSTIDDIVEQIKGNLQVLGHSLDDVRVVALATPGPATEDGVLLDSNNLTSAHWDRFPIREQLEASLRQTAVGIPVNYIGDGQAAALGEFAVRTGRITCSSIAKVVEHGGASVDSELRSLFMVTVGTGLGGGEVRDSTPIRGSQGRAGHAGHLMLPAHAFRYQHDRQLKVGNSYGTTESAISLTGLTHQLGYRLKLEQWRDHPLNHQEGTLLDKAKKLRELASSGDGLAKQLFDDQASAMGIALLMINYLGDYDLLVIGGGICDLSQDIRQRYLATAEKSYYDHALDGFRNLGGLSFSVCGDQASVIGALVQAGDMLAS